MKNKNSLYKLKKIKLQRLIPHYKKLMIDAVKRQDFENAYKYRTLHRTYREKLVILESEFGI
jgi:hypothetical protein